MLAVTAQAARHTKSYLPIGDLLEEAPLTGLRTKASPTGNGIPLVNKLGGGNRLARLEGYPRVQVQTRQISRYSLRPMDLLLRGSTLGSDPRGILVGDLPEEALVGGELVRLRLRPTVSPAWLLAWLRGPGGDRLYENGRLQKPLLRKYRVPIPEEQAELGQNLLLYWALEEKAAQFAQWARTLFDVVLRRVFSKSSVEIAFGEQPEDRLDQYLAQLAQPMSRFLQEMSQFQQELYHSLLLSEKETPVHALFRQMQNSPRPHPSAGIQDARSAAALLAQFGLLEQVNFQTPESEQAEEQQTYLTDHNGRPIWVETYQPTKDIFEENAYAAGADQDTEL